MNIFLDVTIVVVAGLFLWLGLKKGFFKSMVDLIIMILSVIVPYLFASSLAENYYHSFVHNNLISKINDILNQNGSAINSAKNILALVEKIPNFLKIDAVTHGANVNDILKALNGYGDRSLVVANLLKPTIIEVLSMVMFAILFIVTFVVLKILFKFVFKLPRIPIFGLIDSILGLCMGALKFAVFMFVFVIIFKSALLIVPQNDVFKNFNKAIDDSKIFKSLYNINVDVLNDYLKLH